MSRALRSSALLMVREGEHLDKQGRGLHWVEGGGPSWHQHVAGGQHERLPLHCINNWQDLRCTCPVGLEKLVGMKQCGPQYERLAWAKARAVATITPTYCVGGRPVFLVSCFMWAGGGRGFQIRVPVCCRCGYCSTCALVSQ
jgi:hypothetical protein